MSVEIEVERLVVQKFEPGRWFTFASSSPRLKATADAAGPRLYLQVDISTTFVVGDSVWDMLAARRARALGIGLLSGGYGMEELERAGAYRVYEDPADLLEHLDEVGGRR